MDLDLDFAGALPGLRPARRQARPRGLRYAAECAQQMACKKAWSLSARRRPRQRDRHQSTCNSPAAASGAPSAPWSHLLMFVVFTFLLLASSPASLVPPSPVAQPVAHALPLLTHDGARSIALILYLIGLLSSCARATGPRKARQPHLTVGGGRRRRSAGGGRRLRPQTET